MRETQAEELTFFAPSMEIDTLEKVIHCKKCEKVVRSVRFELGLSCGSGLHGENESEMHSWTRSMARLRINASSSVDTQGLRLKDTLDDTT